MGYYALIIHLKVSKMKAASDTRQLSDDKAVATIRKIYPLQLLNWSKMLNWKGRL